MDWFDRDFDHPLYFEIYRSKERDAAEEGPGLAALLGLPAGARVLDLPCGWGRLHPAWEAMGWQVAGGDLSSRNLRRHAEEHPAELVRLDLRALPFRGACADGILCAFTSWGYFASDAENLAQLTEFARVLRPGGALLLDLAGRLHLEGATRGLGDAWYDTGEGYRERVRWSTDRRRILTDRLCRGVRFRHDIWIPTAEEVLAFSEEAGFRLEACWGGLAGEPWRPGAPRWIYRFKREARG